MALDNHERIKDATSKVDIPLTVMQSLRGERTLSKFVLSFRVPGLIQQGLLPDQILDQTVREEDFNWYYNSPFTLKPQTQYVTPLYNVTQVLDSILFPLRPGEGGKADQEEFLERACDLDKQLNQSVLEMLHREGPRDGSFYDEMYSVIQNYLLESGTIDAKITSYNNPNKHWIRTDIANLRKKYSLVRHTKENEERSSKKQFQRLKRLVNIFNYEGIYTHDTNIIPSEHNPSISYIVDAITGIINCVELPVILRKYKVKSSPFNLGQIINGGQFFIGKRLSPAEIQVAQVDELMRGVNNLHEKLEMLGSNFGQYEDDEGDLETQLQFERRKSALSQNLPMRLEPERPEIDFRKRIRKMQTAVLHSFDALGTDYSPGYKIFIPFVLQAARKSNTNPDCASLSLLPPLNRGITLETQDVYNGITNFLYELFSKYILKSFVIDMPDSQIRKGQDEELLVFCQKLAADYISVMNLG